MDHVLWSQINNPPVRRILRFGSQIPERTPILTPMQTCGKICKIKRKKHRGTSLEWQIPEFFYSARNIPTSGCMCSPSFPFLHFSFRLAFYQRDFDILSFYIVSSQELDCQVGYIVGFGKTDGTVENTVSGIIKINESASRQSCDINLSEVVIRKTELAPMNVLTVKCTLKKDSPDSDSDKTPPKLIQYEKLSENFKELFGDEDTCDTTIKVSGKEYKVHRLILIARSPVFAALFKHDTLEKRTGVINIKDCDPESFKKFLEYLYCGIADEVSFRNALGLYQISDKYDVEEVKVFCVDYLTQFLTVENFCEIALFADKYDIEALLSSVQEFFNQNVNQILVTSEWKCLVETHYDLSNNFLLKMPKVDC